MTAYDTNLIVNPGAEAGTATDNAGDVSLPGWHTDGNFTGVRYIASGGALPPPADGGGSNYFAGGPANVGSGALQIFGVDDLSSEIDAGHVTATLSADLGGSGSQDDRILLYVSWIGSGGREIGTLRAPTVYGFDRDNMSGFKPVTISGKIPAGTVSAVVQMVSVGSGTYNDGYADNVSFILHNDSAACFASGTQIRTARGDVAVEDLRIGDLVVTSSGMLRPIRWLGHRTLDCRKLRDPAKTLPIRIAAHAVAENKPARDLLVSPAHAICLDVFGEALFPACALVNGSTITQVEVDTVTYWHIELDDHDILLAENLASESYIDCGNRAFFVEAGIVDLAALPDSPFTTDDYCRPFHSHDALAALVQSRLAARADVIGRAGSRRPSRLSKAGA